MLSSVGSIPLCLFSTGDPDTIVVSHNGRIMKSIISDCLADLIARGEVVNAVREWVSSL